MDTTEVMFERRGHLGAILLNRPKAINALSEAMVDGIRAQLAAWAEDPDVAQVAVRGAGERGLCAGGDIVALRQAAVDGQPEAARAFFEREYAMDAAIAEYSKPYVAFMDGIVLGGGVGVSAHGSVRVVTERTRLGMPETGIGFVPDIGASKLLSEAPGELGTWMALTGEMISGADAIALGLADWYVPSERLEELARALETEPAVDAVRKFAVEPPEPALLADREWIDSCFSSDDPVEIVARLRASGHEDTAATIESKSPSSTFVTLALLRRAPGLTLREALAAELRVGMALFSSGEMVEGIRAQVVDKDRNPSWNPPTLAEVSRERLATLLAGGEGADDDAAAGQGPAGGAGDGSTEAAGRQDTAGKDA
ncbi:enoyl-CoA hydratase/isomerase family protein [Falsarthrobacter nasiphocae]|uniref:3-hydroxyisobutyryl-CoA hydrolase n=1 Tax=Falsarthrobacter nasiphocae TaxID=189863 RepID=A0AAE3YGQ8_9MICC|nr:enoyl-CoA hydratase/isomerase family protein [Falsarthrobacter nasiphocae]MDR6891889.1 enoyl-CoA hydratase [Falsarthrobacter nasiphocae]